MKNKNANSNKETTFLVENNETQEEKYFSFQPVFVWLSVIVMVVCFAFFGYRAYKAYTTDVADGSYLSNLVVKNNDIKEDGNGLYQVGSTYLFKGEVENNYVSYAGFIWRVIQINPDGSTKLIMDQSINQLPYDASSVIFTKSEIATYLNNSFIQYLDKNDLVETTYYDDFVTDIQNMSFDNSVKAYVVLPTVLDFLNTRCNQNSFIYDETNIYWLANNNQSSVYYSKNQNLSLTKSTELFGIRPVITLNKDYLVTCGDGTKENPYKKETTQIQINDVITLGEDNWVVYGVEEDCYRLVKQTALETKQPFGEKGSAYNLETGLGKYLNEDYFNSLSYKQLCKKVIWYNGDYDGTIASIQTSTIECEVGMLNLSDLQCTNATEYYLITTSEKYAFVYQTQVEIFKPVLSYNIIPTIAIDKNTNLIKISDGHYKVGE